MPTTRQYNAQLKEIGLSPELVSHESSTSQRRRKREHQDDSTDSVRLLPALVPEEELVDDDGATTSDAADSQHHLKKTRQPPALVQQEEIAEDNVTATNNLVDTELGQVFNLSADNSMMLIGDLLPELHHTKIGRDFANSQPYTPLRMNFRNLAKYAKRVNCIYFGRLDGTPCFLQSRAQLQRLGAILKKNSELSYVIVNHYSCEERLKDILQLVPKHCWLFIHFPDDASLKEVLMPLETKKFLNLEIHARWEFFLKNYYDEWYSGNREISAWKFVISKNPNSQFEGRISTQMHKRKHERIGDKPVLLIKSSIVKDKLIIIMQTFQSEPAVLAEYPTLMFGQGVMRSGGLNSNPDLPRYLRGESKNTLVDPQCLTGIVKMCLTTEFSTENEIRCEIHNNNSESVFYFVASLFELVQLYFPVIDNLTINLGNSELDYLMHDNSNFEVVKKNLSATAYYLDSCRDEFVPSFIRLVDKNRPVKVCSNKSIRDDDVHEILSNKNAKRVQLRMRQKGSVLNLQKYIDEWKSGERDLESWRFRYEKALTASKFTTKTYTRRRANSQEYLKLGVIVNEEKFSLALESSNSPGFSEL